MENKELGQITNKLSTNTYNKNGKNAGNGEYKPN